MWVVSIEMVSREASGAEVAQEVCTHGSPHNNHNATGGARPVEREDLLAMKTMLACMLLSFTLACGLSAHATPIRQITVKVTDLGYEPERIEATAGQPLRITFVRESDSPCGETLLIPDFSIRRELPLKRPVVVSIVPRRPGTFAFTCGMKMMRGTLVVKPL
ncbi:MAG: hypothetical protein EB084_03575 [Proteobacteria bacterium]|nr:hypothetical protein [Pseudomonadota bacterium]